MRFAPNSFISSCPRGPQERPLAIERIGATASKRTCDLAVKDFERTDSRRNPRQVVLLGPNLNAVSGITTHLNLVLESHLAEEFRLLHFQVGSEGRLESVPGRIWRYLTSPWLFLQFLIRHRPAIVHINTAMVPKAFWRDLVYLLVAKIVGARVAYQVHGGFLPQDFVGGRRLSTALLRAVLRASDVVILLSEIDRREYSALDSGLPIRVVPNAITVEPDSVPRAHNADPRLRLLYVGRLSEAKGIYEIVEALAVLRSKGTDVEMAFVGAGHDEARLKQRVVDLGLSDRVTFTGAVFGKEKDGLWRAADVLVFPSHAEGLPYALLEGMSFGVVPVVCPVGAIPEVMRNEREGLFVSPKNYMELAVAIQRLHLDRSLLRALGEAARERVLEKYTIARLVDDLGRIYRDL